MLGLGEDRRQTFEAFFLPQSALYSPLERYGRHPNLHILWKQVFADSDSVCSQQLQAACHHLSPFFMATLTQTRKRDGSIVNFDHAKITSAMRGAFMEARGTADEVLLRSLTDTTVQKLEELFKTEGITSVEHIQNVVEQVLMEAGFFDVAKAYIIYRYQHEKKREEKKIEVLKKIDTEGLQVTKRNGEKVQFSSEKLSAFVRHFTTGIEDVIDVEAIVKQCKAELYEDIETKKIQQALILVTRAWIEQDPAYSTLASRILMDDLYKDIIGYENISYTDFDSQYRVAFIAYVKKGVQLGKLDPRLLMFDLSDLSRKLVPERDDLLQYLGAQTLYDRYFIRDSYTKAVLETPQFFWMRVAMGLCLEEENKDVMAAEMYEMYSTLRFVSSTPTLFHSGTTLPQLSSCYLTTVEDDLGHIFKCIGDNAQLSKWSGGIGNDWTNLRSTNALIKATGVESQGVVPFLKIANDTTVAINRSGRRRGATCAYLETWHLDIEDFLELRKNTGDDRRRTHDMNTSNWIPDLFMKRVAADGQWTLFSPDETPDLHHTYGKEFERRYEKYEERARNGQMRLHKTMRAKDLWRKMVGMLYETGHPWITWKDPSNVRSPQDHAGVIHSSNLCTEITLNTSADETAVCNLGSVNLAKHIKDGKLDVEKLKETVEMGMRMLDNVININFYPTKEAKNSNLKHRPVGLGIMGFQDALYMLGINFSSEQAVEFADYSMEVISYYAITASAMLAKERGPYESFRGSKWDRGILPLDTMDILERERGVKIPVNRAARMDWNAVRALIKEHGMRNSNTMACAPTATIANISGCFPTIEPIYKNIYVKSNMSGEFTIVNDYLIEDLKKLGLWDQEMLNEIKRNNGSIGNIVRIPDDLKEKYKEVFDISVKHLIDVTAHRGKWIDQSQSFNIFYRGSSGKEISEAYMYAWEMGLKTTYYLRTLAATNIEKSTVALDSKAENQTGGLMSEASKVQSAPKEATTPMPIMDIQKPEAVLAPTPAPIAPPSAPAFEEPVKLCKIGDPDCESCQ